MNICLDLSVFGGVNNVEVEKYAITLQRSKNMQCDIFIFSSHINGN